MILRYDEMDLTFGNKKNKEMVGNMELGRVSGMIDWLVANQHLRHLKLISLISLSNFQNFKLNETQTVDLFIMRFRSN